MVFVSILCYCYIVKHGLAQGARRSAAARATHILALVRKVDFKVEKYAAQATSRR